MSWIAPLNRTDEKGTKKVYLKRFPETVSPYVYMSATDPKAATTFSTKEEAEEAQAITRKNVDALPKAPEWAWGINPWPTIEMLPVEEVL